MRGSMTSSSRRIERGGTTEAERLVAIVGEGDRVALVLKGSAQVTGKTALVFDDQNAHLPKA